MRTHRLAGNPEELVGGKQVAPTRISKKRLFVLLLVYLSMGIFYLFAGQLNEDEGWYLYAGKLVYQGKTLYSDFSYTQSPLLPYVYGALGKVFGTGLYLGRAISLSLGAAAFLLSILVCNRIAGRLAATICALAISLNPLGVYCLTITKTHSLAALFLLLSVFSLTVYANKPLRYSLSTLFLCLAAGVRLNMACALPVLLVYIFLVEKENRKVLFLAAGVGFATLGAIFLPFVFREPWTVLHNIVGHHMARYDARGISHAMRLKVKTLRSIFKNFNFLVLCLLSGVIRFLFRNGKTISLPRRERAVTLHILAVLLVIFISNFVPGGSSVEYQVLVLPLAAIIGGIVVWGWFARMRTRVGRTAILCVACALISVNFAVRLMDYADFSGGRLPISEVTEISQYIEENVGPDEPILTQHTYLAVQSGRDVLPGLEMSLFSFYPDYNTETAGKYRVLNTEMVKEMVASKRAAAVILTDFSFTRSATSARLGDTYRNEIISEVKKHYRLVKTMENFGMWRDTVYVYLRENQR